MTQNVEGTSQNCSKILKKLGLKEWELGKTKVHQQIINLHMKEVFNVILKIFMLLMRIKVNSI